MKNKAFLFFKTSFLHAAAMGALFSLAAYATLGNFGMPARDALTLFPQAASIIWLFYIAGKLLFSLLLWLGERIALRSVFSVPKANMAVLVTAFCIFCTAVPACNHTAVYGVDKDISTGMLTTYRHLKPAKTVLVMNNEVLGHTQIPLGESFMVVNEQVNGLTVKDYKVSIGCSLLITDKNGKSLLDNPDLFKDDGGVYTKENARFLRCTINTGEPMEWEEEYTVTVKFWDKLGEGSIENKFKITMIDIP